MTTSILRRGEARRFDTRRIFVARFGRVDVLILALSRVTRSGDTGRPISGMLFEHVGGNDRSGRLGRSKNCRIPLAKPAKPGWGDQPSVTARCDEPHRQYRSSVLGRVV